MRILRLVPLAIVTLSVAYTAAYGASFDCAKAKAPDEIAICTRPDLSALDSEMGGLWFAYKQVPMLMGSNGARHDDAVEFMKARTACGADVDCLRRIYVARIKVLQVALTAAFKGIFADENGPQTTATQLPEPVEKIIANYGKQCQQLGGTLTGDVRPGIMTADLDGDGKQDFVLNPQNLKCTAAATAYCGNGGCQIAIATSRNDYQNAISAMGGQPTISQRADGTDVEIWVDRMNCKDAGRDKACWEIYSWANGKSSTRYESRPIPAQ
jgi:uncharacterized protein